MEIASKMFFGTVTEGALYLSYVITPHGKNNFRFYGRYIGLPETVEDAIKMASGSPNIFRKSHQGAPLNS